MFALMLLYWMLLLLSTPMVGAKDLIQVANLADLGDDYNCPGGNIYFVAHPIDALLYQNPDLYHDLHTFKCTTLVVLTAGDRGTKDTNFTQLLERGLEASYNFMAGAPLHESGWDGVKVACNKTLVNLRYPNDARSLLLIYLRFPDGASDGYGYNETDRVSLKRLYQRQIKTISSIDGETTYDLNGLKHLIQIILQWKRPSTIRILDNKTPIAADGDFSTEHADHSTSAQIVQDVIREHNITGKVTSYGGNLIRNLGPTLEKASENFALKVDAYKEYARFDKDVCKTYSQCPKHSGLEPKEVPDDIKFTTEYLNREYYVV